jgi:succinoglycan biosynthesis protein ExoA
MTNQNAQIAPKPRVAVVIPCRNEAPFIRPVIDALLASTYPRERLEILFVDGMSTDGTRAILEAAAREHPFIRVLDNPRVIAPVAMNLGINAARSEIIVRMDAHSEYEKDYIPRCVGLLLRSGPKVGNAGGRGVPLPYGESPWARPISYILGHRFGVGGTACRTSSHAGFVDTVPFGTYSRAVLVEIGLYDERLTRNQDHELNARLRRAGYAIAYDPTIRIHYRPRANLKGLSRQAFFTGMWNVYTLRLHPYTWKWRRFIPGCFVAYLAGLALLTASGRGFAAAAIPLGLYALLVAMFSIDGAGSGGAPRVAATFSAYHLSFGAGTIFGVANLLTGRWRKYLGRPLG